MVINGRWEFVGSNSVKARSNIEDELTRRPKTKVELDHRWAPKERVLEVGYMIQGQSVDSELIFAILESKLQREILKGENRGRTLKHENVVRILQTVEIDKMVGQWKIQIPLDVKIASSGLLHGPVETLLPQSVYVLEHKKLGTLEIFLVPVEQDQDYVFYEAIFN